MPLTQAQKLTLRTHIQANATILAFAGGNATVADAFAALAQANVGDATIIADWYDLATSPAQYAWRFTISRMEQRRALMNTSGAGAQLDALTASKREALLWGIDDTTDCRLSEVRACIENWCGSQNTLKAAIIDSFKRHLSNVQSVFTTGTKSFAAPGDNATDGGFEGSVNANDILEIRGMA